MPLVTPQDAFGHTQQAFGPPPGLVYPPGLQNNVVNDGKHTFSPVSERAACVRYTERRALLGQGLSDYTGHLRSL